jgi:hypothetical protein
MKENYAYLQTQHARVETKMYSSIFAKCENEKFRFSPTTLQPAKKSCQSQAKLLETNQGCLQYCFSKIQCHLLAGQAFHIMYFSTTVVSGKSN